jgi:hypothetical protein
MDNENAIEAKKHFNIPPRLIDEILNGSCIAFIGAGLSRGAGLPDWKSMIVKMLDWSEQNNVLLDTRADVEKMIDSGRYLDAAGHAVVIAQPLQFTSPAEEVREFLEELKDGTPRRFPYVVDNLRPITIFDSVINLGPAVIFQDCYLTNGAGNNFTIDR